MSFFKNLVYNSTSDGEAWINKYWPKEACDLAVNSRKVKEVHNWLDNSLQVKDTSILLLTGPSGCGKLSTCLTFPNARVVRCDDFDTVEQFNDFLFKVSRFDDINNLSDRKMKCIAIKELPNQYYTYPKSFNETITNYKSQPRCPLIIIISDSQNMQYSANNLIPKELKAELNIRHITFNSIAVTQMKKCLKKILLEENLILSLKDKQCDELISDICTRSAGDIRHAINCMQIACALNHKYDVSGDNNKDTRLFIFRALGRILYCKRETDAIRVTVHRDRYPSFLKDYLYRTPLMVNPEEVVLASGLDPGTFVDILHSNFLDLLTCTDNKYNLLDRAVEATDWFSISDCLQRFDLSGDSGKWNVIGEIGGAWWNCAVRGLIFHTRCGGGSNSGSVGGYADGEECQQKNAWRPMRGSQLTVARHKLQEMYQASTDWIQLIGSGNMLVNCKSKSVLLNLVPYSIRITNLGQQKTFKNYSKVENSPLQRVIGHSRLRKLLSFSNTAFSEEYKEVVIGSDDCVEEKSGNCSDVFVVNNPILNPSGAKNSEINLESWILCQQPNEDNIDIDDED